MDDTKPWKVINYFIDFSFLADIILTFMTSYYNEENNTHVCTHKAIAISYLKSWFFFDVLSILPMELILSSLSNSRGSHINSIAKFSRIGRLYKLWRLVRMTKLMRLIKSKNKIRKNLD